MSNMNVRVLALVTDAFGGQGGIAQYNRDLIESLAECEWIDEIIVLPRAGTVSGELPSRIRQLPPRGSRVAYCFAAMHAALKNRIDVVFCGHLFMAPLAVSVAKFLRVPCWIQVHGIEAWEQRSKLSRWCMQRAAFITSVSRYTRRRLLEWVNIDPARVKVLPNTVDPRFCPRPKPPQLLERYNIKGKRVLLTVSRLASTERYKGQDRVIRALPNVLAVYPDTVYLIVGDGDDRPRLESLAVELNVRDHVCFAGWISAEALPNYYCLADAFVMPSLGEGFGIAFLEAMACGIPVIGGNRDGSLDPLADGILGGAINPENETEIPIAICSALNKSMPAAVDVRRFDTDNFTEHVHAVVRTMLDSTA